MLLCDTDKVTLSMACGCALLTGSPCQSPPPYYFLIIIKVALNFSGGIRFTVSGSSLDSVYEAYMTITATASDVDDLEFRAVSRVLEGSSLYKAVN